MNEHENVILEAIRRGALSIDAEGRIWREKVFTRVGNLKAIPRRRADRPRTDGYLDVRVGRKHWAMSHRIVWLALVGPIPDRYEINHENGVRGDNRPSNLEPTTPAKNTLHSYRVLGKRPVSGENNGRAKLTLEQVRIIRASSGSARGLARQFSVTHRVILRIRRRESWWPEYPEVHHAENVPQAP